MKIQTWPNAQTITVSGEVRDMPTAKEQAALNHITDMIAYLNAATESAQHAYDTLTGMDTPTVIPLDQHGQPWGGVTLGFSTHGQTIATHGCAITALAMWLNFVTVGGAYTPATVNDELKSHGGYVWDDKHTDQNLVNWPALPSIFGQLKFNGKINCPSDPAPMPIVDAMLDAGLPVIVYVDAEKYVAGLQQHFVLITKKRTTTYDIANPWTGTMQTLTPQYGDTPAHAVCGIVQLAVAV